jgi:hypothetical protein
MAATNFTSIVIYNTATGAAVPLAANMLQGELAVNVTDKKLFTKDAGGNVVLVGVDLTTAQTLTNKTLTAPVINNPTGTGFVTSVNGASGAVTGIVDTGTAQTLTNKTLTGYTETVYALTGTTPAFTEANGSIQTWTLSAASTPTDALTTGQSLILQITPGANTLTWPSVVWTKQGGGGAAPTLYSAGKTNVILWKVGATLFGSHLGDA